MKLHWSPRSPFVRKVMVVAHELGVAESITCVRSVATATKPNPAIMADNPLSKIPTLVTEDGTVIADSPVICEYLDLRFGDGTVVPRDGQRRVEALTRQALGDGLLDLLLLWRSERDRAPTLQSEPHLQSYALRTRATLDYLVGQVESWPAGRFDVGDVALACMLSYLDFRFPAVDWRDGRAALARWHETVADRPSMVAATIVDEPVAV